ncbi:MAG: pyruvate ferredoxin oxidoreductase [Patescibacteria group bacterium]
MRKILEGSIAVAEMVKLCRPAVVSAYPITPQTHIVEELAKLKAEGFGDYEFVRAESEFSAASIVLGASASGVRAYTATSSQGLLYMAEVVFTIAGMRLPVVMTCANRAISAPINIWNDEQDSMTVRDSGWIMLYAENNQEAVDLHAIAFKVAEQLNIPVMVNMDGFVLTHTTEPVDIPEQKIVDQYLPSYSPKAGEFLEIRNPVSLGALATPEHYQSIREDLHQDLLSSQKVLLSEMKNFKKIFGRGSSELVEYYGDPRAKKVLLSRGSICGTIKEVIDNTRGVGLLRIKSYRPFPVQEIRQKLKFAKDISVFEKCVSLGSGGILAGEVRNALFGENKKINSFVGGLGGRDITVKMIEKIIKATNKNTHDSIFL